MRIEEDYSNYIHQSKYARWLEEEGRRETWEETVDRYIGFFRDRHVKQLGADVFEELRLAILTKEVMPSMRALMTAGPALERDHMAGYNCAFTNIDSPKAFDEMLYILMCGTGEGFSVERQYISNLPVIAEEFHKADNVIVVKDSKVGWATAYKELLAMLWVGTIPKWDLSRLRPAGAVLKTFGGRSSGPEPLNSLFEFTVHTFLRAAGRKLNSIECHDLCCKIAEIVVVGGVRRSALISLSNLTDMRMRSAKTGEWWHENSQRGLSNNSVAYTEKPDVGIFMDEWKSLYTSKSGERGIFSREAANNLLPDRRKELGYTEWGTNPCAEIVLRSNQLCNLSEVVVRPEDTLEDLKIKVALATILGTMQSTLTDFRYVRRQWKKNCEEERLLGVSLTGIMDHPLMNGSSSSTHGALAGWLDQMKAEAILTNKAVAKKLGINQSTAITCVKPSGTVSQLVNSASGIHARYAPYYIRTVRNDNKDPLTAFLISEGVPHELDVRNPNATVFSFPMAAPSESVCVDEVNAIDQLELWKTYQLHWCEHKPSVTVYVKEDEWLEVAGWVYKHFDIVSGISFLPYSDHNYKQAPYQQIDKAAYTEAIKSFPKINWENLRHFESSDMTTSSQELACTAGGCEI